MHVNVTKLYTVAVFFAHFFHYELGLPSVSYGFMLITFLFALVKLGVNFSNVAYSVLATFAVIMISVRNDNASDIEYLILNKAIAIFLFGYLVFAFKNIGLDFVVPIKFINLYLLFVLILLIVSYISGGSVSRRIIIFGEPSHFYMANIPLFFMYMYSTKRIVFPLLFIGTVFILFPSLIGLSIFIFCFLLWNRFGIAKLITLFFILATVFSFVPDYIEERFMFEDISMNSESTNILLNGYLQAYGSIGKNLVGYGFDLSGRNLNYEHNQIVERMFSEHGFPISIAEGGHLFGKIVADLGLMGFVVLLGFGYFMLFAIIESSRRRNIVAFVLIVSFVPQIFLRHLTYYSPYLFFCLVSTFEVLKNAKKIQKN